MVEWKDRYAKAMITAKDVGEFRVYVATHSNAGNPLPQNDWHVTISDGYFGECYQGDGDGARKLAANLIAAADAYDEMVAELGKLGGL